MMTNAASLSPAQRVAQLLMPSLHPIRYRDDEQYREQIWQLVEAGVGGFCVFQGSVEETAQILAELQALAEIPLLFSADFEHGLSMRLEGATDFPHAMALGNAHDTHLTAEVARAVARECVALGVHWNFAPVCDVNSNRNNPIINTRAFGETIGDVIPQVSAWIESSQSLRVAACAKHFPGHGDSAVDSHLALPTLELSRERLTSVELVPFLAAIRAGVQSVMIGHLDVPAFDGSGTPASLSKPIIQGILRDYMKYDGVVVTDALDMHSISKSYSSAEACIRALNAGNDIALIPENAQEALEGLLAAAESGQLVETRIVDSVRRVLALKSWCGLMDRRQHPREIVSLEEHGMLALKAATNALNVQGAQEVLPIEQYKHIAVFALLSSDDIDPASEFFHFLSQVYENNTDIAYMNSSITDEEIQAYANDTAEAECVIFAVFAKPRSYVNSVGLDPRLVEATRVLRGNRPTIAVLFGNPYLADELDADTTIRCFSDSKPSRGAACLALSNKNLHL